MVWIITIYIVLTLIYIFILYKKIDKYEMNICSLEIDNFKLSEEIREIKIFNMNKEMENEND